MFDACIELHYSRLGQYLSAIFDIVRVFYIALLMIVAAAWWSRQRVERR